NIAVLGQLGAWNIHVPGLAVSVNGGCVVLTVHGHRHRVASLHILTNRTRDSHVGFRLSLVDHVVTGNGVDRNGGFGQVGVYTVAAVGFSRSGVTGRVFSLNLGVNIAVLDQLSTKHVHVPALATGVTGRGVVLAVHGHSDGVASLDVLTNRTGASDIPFRLSLVDHVVTGNGVDRDGGFGQVSIDSISTVSFSRSGVARCVFRGSEARRAGAEW